MSARRTRIRRAALFGLAIVIFLYAALVGLRVLYPVNLLDLVRNSARAVGLDPALVCALVRAESRFHADAVSSRGAIGLMQIMPDTGAWIAGELGAPPPDLYDPETNLRFGAWYLRYLVNRFSDVAAALTAYNAGPTRVDEWLAQGGGERAAGSTYVRRVLRAVPVYRLYLAVPILISATPALPI